MHFAFRILHLAALPANNNLSNKKMHKYTALYTQFLYRCIPQKNLVFYIEIC